MFTLEFPVCIVLPVEVAPPEGGGAPGTFTVDMRYLGVRGRLDTLKRIGDENLTDRQVLDEMLVGWDGLVDEAGAHLDFNDHAVRNRVLDVPWVYAAVRDAVLAELGLGPAPDAGGAAAKNS